MEMKEYRLPCLTLLFWVLFPVVAFNELVFGQRVPRLTLICESCELSLPERQYVPCLSCGFIIGLSWSLFMWIVASVIPSLWRYWNSGRIEIKRIIFEAGLWLVGGVFVGFIEHAIFNQKGGNDRHKWKK
jgi:hypothetical protein